MWRKDHIGRISSAMLTAFLLTLILGFAFAPSARSENPVGWYCQRWDQPEPYVGIAAVYHSVAAVDASTAWVAGVNGSILKTTDGGANWNVMFPVGPSASLCGIAAVNANTAWAIGNSGTTYGIIKTDDGGTTWNLQYYETTNALYGILSVSPSIAWVVGNQIILKTTDGGKNWIQQNPGVDASFNDVAAVNENTAWAVGSNGTIIQTTDGGSTWSQHNSGTDMELGGIAAFNSTTAWAVGFDGTILHTTNGKDWIIQAETQNRLEDIAAVDTNTAWAVGMRGTVLKTTDGGTTWNPQYPWPAHDLYGISKVDANTAWAVGNRGTIFHTTDGGEGNPPRPFISTLWSNPPKGPPGTELWIEGTHFGSTQPSSYVSFGSVQATQYTEWNDYKIKCLVPPIAGPVTVAVKVTTPYGSSNEFDYTITLPAPTVTSITPTSSYSSSAVNVEIAGTGFQEGAQVYMHRMNDSIDAGYLTGTNTVVVSSIKITTVFYLPNWWTLWRPLLPMNPCYDVIVTNPDGNSGTRPGTFTILQNPYTCGLGALYPVMTFGLAMGILSIAGSLRLRKRRKLS